MSTCGPPRPKKMRLRDQARTLRHFRLIRGPGGGMNDFGDRLEVAFRIGSAEDVARILAALGAALPPSQESPRDADAPAAPGGVPPVTFPQTIVVQGVQLNSFTLHGRLDVWFNDAVRQYDITPVEIEQARRLEELLEPVADLVIDPHAQRKPPRSVRRWFSERMTYASIAIGMAALSVLLGMWSHASYHEYLRYETRYGDFERWTQSPGTLVHLRLRQAYSGQQRGYYVHCEYHYAVAGRRYTGTDFSLEFNTPTLGEDSAKARVERLLGIAGRAQWRAFRFPQSGWMADPAMLDGWELVHSGLPVTVRHSALDPAAASLTDAPPAPVFFYWLGFVLQCLGALVAAALAVFMALAAIPPSGNPPQA